MNYSNSEEMSYEDAVSTVPINAWLLMGDEGSYPSPSDLRKMHDGEWELEWTGPSQAQCGDLLFFYFMHTTKEIRFAARVAGIPVYDTDAQVNTKKQIDTHQWWVSHTPMVEVPPITFKELNEEMGGGLILRGKPTHYLSPKVVKGLLARMSRGDQATLLGESSSEVLRVPVGEVSTPSPKDIDLPTWRAMADGPLKLEAQVEEYVVEPLLRMAFAGHSDVTIGHQPKIKGAGIADYKISVGDDITGVVEVKTAIQVGRGGNWAESAHLKQLQKYMNALGTPGLLIDSNNAFLFRLGDSEPSRVLNRISATEEDIEAIGKHLAG